jgi:hypothetical protein
MIAAEDRRRERDALVGDVDLQEEATIAPRFPARRGWAAPSAAAKVSSWLCENGCL